MVAQPKHVLTFPTDDQKLAPHSEEAEEAVIGSILINPHIIHGLKSWLLPHMFFMVRLSWVYEAMLALAHRGEHISLLTICVELEMRHQVEEVGGSVRADVYLMGIENNTPTHIHASTYAKYVKEMWRRRHVVNLAGQLAKVSYSFSPDGVESAEAKRLVEEMRELMNDPYDPEVDGLVQNLIHARDIFQLPEISWLRPGEIPDRGLTILFGPSGAGKSFLALDYALQIAQQNTVLYVAAEGEGGMKQRVMAWTKHHHQAVGELFFYLNVAALLDTPEYEKFRSQIVARVSPKLIILDTVAHCMLPGDENSARDMGMFVRRAKEFQKQYGCAVLLVHHTSKEGAIERGSTSLRGAADSMIRLTSEDDVITIECSKSKDAQPFPTRYMKLLPVQIEAEKYAPVIVPAEMVKQTTADPLTNNQHAILEALANVFEFGASATDLAELLQINRRSIYRIASRLKTLGYISQSENKPYSITDAGRSVLGQSSVTPEASQGHPPVTGQNPDAERERSGVTPKFMNFESTQGPNQPVNPVTTVTMAQTGPKLAVTSNDADLSRSHKCPMCDKPLEKTRKGYQCPDCGAIWPPKAS